LKRFEDPRLVTGQGSFVDDLRLPGMLYAVVLRSPHARILSLDAAPARALPGVAAVLTASDSAGAVRDIPPRAAHLLDCRPEDMVFQDGKLVNERRSEHALTFAEVATADMLELRTATRETPSPTNPLRLKGIGELPTVACAVAIANAALDALSGTNVRHLDAPLSAAKVWRALQERAL
jgi:CO/xanthine dehydrogenase Mo-binding subunit